MFEELSEQELELLVGGEFISVTGITAYLTLFAVLIAVYKIYNSTKGKAKIGNDYSFEWS